MGQKCLNPITGWISRLLKLLRVFLDENGTETRVDYLPWDQGHPSGEPGEECGFFGTNLKCQTTQCDYEFCIGCFFQQQVLSVSYFLASIGNLSMIT